MRVWTFVIDRGRVKVAAVNLAPKIARGMIRAGYGTRTRRQLERMAARIGERLKQGGRMA